MVDLHVDLKAIAIQRLRNELLLAPVDIPVVLLRLTVLSAFQGRQNAIIEVRFEADVRAESADGLQMDWVAFLPDVFPEIFTHEINIM